MHYIDNSPLNDSRCARRLGDWTIPDEFGNVSGGISPTLDSIEDERAFQFATALLGRHELDKKVLVLIVGAMLMHFREWWDLMLSHPEAKYKDFNDHQYSGRIMFAAQKCGILEDELFEFGDKIEVEFVKANYAYIGMDLVHSILGDKSQLVQTEGLMGMARHMNSNVNSLKADFMGHLQATQAKWRHDREWQVKMLEEQTRMADAQERILAMMAAQHLNSDRDGVEEEEKEEDTNEEARRRRIEARRMEGNAGQIRNMYSELSRMEVPSLFVNWFFYRYYEGIQYSESGVNGTPIVKVNPTNKSAALHTMSLLMLFVREDVNCLEGVEDEKLLREIGVEATKKAVVFMNESLDHYTNMANVPPKIDENSKPIAFQKAGRWLIRATYTNGGVLLGSLHWPIGPMVQHKMIKSLEDQLNCQKNDKFMAEFKRKYVEMN